MAEIGNTSTIKMDDLCDVIDIISTYSCKLCNFSSTNAQAIRSHVSESHSNSSAATVSNGLSQFSVNQEKCGSYVAMNVLVSLAENSNVVGDVKPSSDTIVKLNFICSSCDTCFCSSEILNHMTDVHGVREESLVAKDKYHQATPTVAERGSPDMTEKERTNKNFTNTGTQVELYKKRGRKRKIVVELSEEDKEDTLANDHSDSRDSFVTTVKKEVVDNSSTKTRASRVLEIDRLMEVVSDFLDLPKRQIRPPKTLVDDYHIVHQRHWKRNASSSATGQKLRCELEGCGATFSSEKGLEYHASCHVTGDDAEEESGLKFCCPECSSIFLTWIELRVHLLELHDVSVDKFHCESCDFRAETASLLEEHNLAVHAVEANADEESAPVSSGIKKARRGRPPAIKESEDTLSTEDSECPECKRKFSDVKSMRRHIEIVHNKVKPFMCSICGHSTAYKAMLQQHMRKHTGEKPYRCDLCMYSASDRNTLLRHRARHNKQKSFPCSFCAYSYIREKSLKHHMESKHPEVAPVSDGSPTAAAKPGRPPKTKVPKPAKAVPTVYACNSCRYQTVNKRSYLSHMATHEESQPPPDGAAAVVEPAHQAVTEACSVLSSLADAATILTNHEMCGVISSIPDVSYSVLSA